MKHLKPKLSPSDETVVMGKKSWESLWGETMDTTRLLPKPKGEGWKSVAELAEARGTSTRSVQFSVASKFKAGLLERRLFLADNRTQPVYFYRPVVKPSKKG